MILDEYTKKALNKYKPVTRAVYKYYIVRLINKYGDISKITYGNITEFSKNYRSSEIIERIILSFLKKRKEVINNERQ